MRPIGRGLAEGQKPLGLGLLEAVFLNSARRLGAGVVGRRGGGQVVFVGLGDVLKHQRRGLDRQVWIIGVIEAELRELRREVAEDFFVIREACEALNLSPPRPW
jgi:hypothetical protein